jgi:NAD(P)-dependent dehydrogenase (short-subunit alcohol dehydrogenase family)
MKGRTALVTGASRGIGTAVADRMEALGATVLRPARAELDLADDASVDEYLRRLSVPVDILVNNAGINPLASILELTDEDLETTLKVDLVSPIRLARGLAPGMVERGWGRIVNISSVWAIVTKPRRFAYTVAKTGLVGATRSLAMELAGGGVIVNAVAPGFVDTELTRANNTPAELAAIAAGLPLGRMGTPAEIAEVVAFLASDLNTFITGQVIVADGGYSCL